MKKYRNTFGPPHLKNEWVTLDNVLQGLPLGIFKYVDLPDEVKQDIKIHFEKQQIEQKTITSNI